MSIRNDVDTRSTSSASSTSYANELPLSDSAHMQIARWCTHTTRFPPGQELKPDDHYILKNDLVGLVANYCEKPPEKRSSEENSRLSNIKVVFRRGLFQEDNYQEALLSACERGKDEIVRILLRKENKKKEGMDLSLREQAIRIASTGAVVEHLLKNGPVEQQTLRKVMNEACEAEGWDVVEVLNRQEIQIPQEHISEALFHFVQEGRAIPIQKILQTSQATGQEIHPWLLGDLLTKTAASNDYKPERLAIVRALLQNNIQPKDRERAVIAASAKGNDDMLRLLLEGASIPEEVLNQAWAEASRLGPFVRQKIAPLLSAKIPQDSSNEEPPKKEPKSNLQR